MENDLASSAVILCGSDHLKKKFLTRLIEEPLMASCVTETGAGSVVAEAEANAEKKDCECNAIVIAADTAEMSGYIENDVQNDPEMNEKANKFSKLLAETGDSAEDSNKLYYTCWKEKLLQKDPMMRCCKVIRYSLYDNKPYEWETRPWEEQKTKKTESGIEALIQFGGQTKDVKSAFMRNINAAALNNDGKVQNWDELANTVAEAYKDSAMGQEEGSYADIAMDRVKVSCIDSATYIDAVSRKLTEVFRYAYAEGRKEFENYVKIHHTSEFENYVGKESKNVKGDVQSIVVSSAAGFGKRHAQQKINELFADSAMGQEEGSYADIAMDRVKVSSIDSETDIDAVSRKLTEVFQYAYVEARKEFENYVKIHHTSEFENYVGKVRACWQKQGSGLKIDDCLPSSELFRGFVFIGDGEYAGRCIPIESLE
ncbi:hypothetical protein DdX_12574 [Ditylenchus destructor]|uniref:Uncharacterized protein n=1 Tax=Ditylenchus destructor TaxID=166010 RepID=A0AAD4MW66_9BILA|nr:hypothetical protein DdX_12574 [Ditylenchus destructor]